jgi:very-short-patch-repair endonuclease
MSALEEELALQLQLAGFPQPLREYQFAAPKRRWRFDFCWPDKRVAVETQGGVWTRGKHGRGSGITKDYEKLNNAQIMGWKVLQFTSSQVQSGEALRDIERALMG